MIMRRFVAYLPKLIASVLRDYGEYDRDIRSAGAIGYIGMEGGSIIKINALSGVLDTFTPHTDDIFGMALDDDNNILTASKDGTFKKIDSDGNVLWTHDKYAADTYGTQCWCSGEANFIGTHGGDLAKLDADGAEVWEITSGLGNIIGIRTDSSGNIFVIHFLWNGVWSWGECYMSKISPAGIIQDTVLLDNQEWDQPDEFWVWSQVKDRHFFVAFDISHDDQIYVGGAGWDEGESKSCLQYRVYNTAMEEIARITPEVVGWEQITALELDPQKNAVFTNHQNRADTPGHTYLYKYDADHNRVWENDYDCGATWLSHLALDAQGNVYICQWAANSVVMYSKDGTFVKKIDLELGEHVWGDPRQQYIVIEK